MAIDNDDIEDAFNLAVAQIDQWLSDGLSAFMNGPIDRAADTVWRGQSPETQENTRQQLPGAASVLDNLRKKGIS